MRTPSAEDAFDAPSTFDPTELAGPSPGGIEALVEPASLPDLTDSDAARRAENLAKDFEMLDLWPGSAHWQGRRRAMSSLSQAGPLLQGHTSWSDVGRLLVSMGGYEGVTKLMAIHIGDAYNLPGGYRDPGDVQVVAAAAWGCSLHCAHLGRGAYYDAFNVTHSEYNKFGMLQVLMKDTYLANHAITQFGLEVGRNFLRGHTAIAAGGQDAKAETMAGALVSAGAAAAGVTADSNSESQQSAGVQPSDALVPSSRARLAD